MILILLSLVLTAPPDVGDSLYFATPVDVVEVMLADVGPDDVLYDLGCGNGWVCIAATQQCKKAVGIDIDPEMVALARKNVRNHGAERVTIHQGDARKADFSEATVVAAYLSPNLLEALSPKFAALRPGTRVVSHEHPVPGLGSAKTTTVRSVIDDRDHKVFVYTIAKPKTPMHGLSGCNCDMCHGLHVMASHDVPRREVEKMIYSKQAKLHRSLHGPPEEGGCADGSCETRRGLFGRRR